MNTDELKQIALAAAKDIKSQQDLTEFQQMLTKVTVEAALNAELDDHLGYERHEKSEGSNHRNGYSSKRVQTDVGQFELNTPRDRNGEFEPKLVKKNQRVELHQKLTQVLHLKVTHLEEPEYGSIGFCFSSFDLLGFFRRAVFKPIAVVAGFDDVAVMSQAVE
jgi:hypothetical protein